MKKLLPLFVLILLLPAGSFLLTGCAPGKPAQSAEPEAIYANYFKAANVEYALDVATRLTENPEFFNAKLGGRNSGSDAEHRVADFLAKEMSDLGLKDVAKEPFPVAKWQFNGASLTVDGQAEPIELYSYASGQTPPEGIATELVYVKKGTAADYEGLDVKGKVVLAEINQRADWWVTMPTLQAALEGAAAILTYQNGGFSEISKDALNCQDMCGPVSIPSLSIGMADAKKLIALADKGKVNVLLKVDNVVEPGGVSYNVVGRIPGANPDEMVVIGDHYDTHFTGFQDDSCAVGLTLAIAKGMLQSGYQPQRTIVFILHGAEEYGAIDTPSDWSIGAWNEVCKIHPDWSGKAIAYLNFELPAYEFGKTARTDSVPELSSFISEFAKGSPNAPAPDGCFPDGVVDGLETYTYSDDFSYQIAGIPSLANGFLLTDDGADAFPFYHQIYHSQYDNKDTYNAAVLGYHLQLYGSLAIALDQTPLVPLDFAKQAERLINSFDTEIATAAGADVSAFTAALDLFRQVSQETYEQVANLNHSYAEAAAKKAAGTTVEVKPNPLEGVPSIAKTVNPLTLKAFKAAADSFVKVSAGTTPIVGHQYYQDNIRDLQAAVDALKTGDVNRAIDDHLWNVNGIINYYAYYFDKPVVQHMYDQLQNSENLYWSSGKVMTSADVTDVTMALYAKYDTKGPFGEEIRLLEQEIAKQQQLLKAQLQAETKSLTELTGILEEIGRSLLIK